MSTRIRNHSDRNVRYVKLRALYDRAFREWIEETRRRDLLAAHSEHDQETQAEGNARIAGARRAFQDRRDALAKFLTTSQRGNAAYSRVQDAAYFIWLNAGRPSGTAASDWFSAQKQLSAL